MSAHYPLQYDLCILRSFSDVYVFPHWLHAQRLLLSWPRRPDGGRFWPKSQKSRNSVLFVTELVIGCFYPFFSWLGRRKHCVGVGRGRVTMVPLALRGRVVRVCCYVRSWQLVATRSDLGCFRRSSRPAYRDTDTLLKKRDQLDLSYKKIVKVDSLSLTYEVFRQQTIRVLVLSNRELTSMRID